MSLIIEKSINDDTKIIITTEKIIINTCTSTHPDLSGHRYEEVSARFETEVHKNEKGQLVVHTYEVEPLDPTRLYMDIASVKYLIQKQTLGSVMSLYQLLSFLIMSETDPHINLKCVLAPMTFEVNTPTGLRTIHTTESLYHLRFHVTHPFGSVDKEIILRNEPIYASVTKTRTIIGSTLYEEGGDHNVTDCILKAYGGKHGNGANVTPVLASEAFRDLNWLGGVLVIHTTIEWVHTTPEGKMNKHSGGRSKHIQLKKDCRMNPNLDEEEEDPRDKDPESHCHYPVVKIPDIDLGDPILDEEEEDPRDKLPESHSHYPVVKNPDINLGDPIPH